MNQTDIVRHNHLKIPSASLVGTLERLAWERGAPQDAGIFFEHTKPFPGANVTAVVQYEGIPIGDIVNWEDQKLETSFFVQGIYHSHGYPGGETKVPLSQVDPVAVSEVLNDLAALAGKGR